MNEDFKNLNPIDSDPELGELETQVFTEMAKIEGVAELFRAYMNQDLKNHFNAPKEQQDIVRGGFYRTRHFSKLLKKNSLK